MFEAVGHVLGHGQVGKQGRLLVDGGDALRPRGAWIHPYRGAARDGQRSVVHRLGAGHDFDQRRFPRAVLTDERVDLAGAQVERHALQRVHAGKRFGDRFSSKQDAVEWCAGHAWRCITHGERYDRTQRSQRTQSQTGFLCGLRACQAVARSIAVERRLGLCVLPRHDIQRRNRRTRRNTTWVV